MLGLLLSRLCVLIFGFYVLCCTSVEQDGAHRRLATLSQTFSTVGNNNFVVPSGVTTLTVNLFGASGGDTENSGVGASAIGGLGGTITANIPVTPGETLQVTVGGQGSQLGVGGINGGGDSCTTGTSWPGGSGGGATDIRRYPYDLASRLVVAGGGGGSYSEYVANGGNAGYPAGIAGGVGDGSYTSPSGFTPGGGGSATAGGAPGSDCTAGGALGQGAACCPGPVGAYGAAGGGGYYGGGGAYAAAGGGGSSWTSSGYVQSGTASVAGPGGATLTWQPTPSAAPTAAPTTALPTYQPTTLAPSIKPTPPPSLQPTLSPTTTPSVAPSTSSPTLNPTANPTFAPTYAPTQNPTCNPTAGPTPSPSRNPTVTPTASPSCAPTPAPTLNPTAVPTASPTASPTLTPTAAPTAVPTCTPTAAPTVSPTVIPTASPTCIPTAVPTARPTSQPSSSPTSQPSRQPSSQPSRQPSSQPSRQPSGRPTAQPSAGPTSQPSRQPSSSPSRQPSGQPSASPTRQPSSVPTSQPSCQPSGRPTAQPSAGPTSQPSSQPSSHPSAQPSTHPTSHPTSQPSRQPSSQPTRQPSGKPSGQPSSHPSSQPSAQPSVHPTTQPSAQPSRQPTGQPTGRPTAQPSTHPTAQPSRQPSSAPSQQPTAQPSAVPSRPPTAQPTRQPSGQPSSSPSTQPSSQPSTQPSRQPSAQPSIQPTGQPTGRPSAQPTRQPSRQPTGQPSSSPTSQPSSQPSGQPTTQPSAQPSGQPSSQPSARPTGQPSTRPTSQPSGQPSRQPTGQPSAQPSGQPTAQPSAQPSGSPTTQPTGKPTGQPSMQPSNQPSSQPSRQPTAQPSAQPSGQPTAQPSAQPSGQPSSQPSAKPTSQPSTHPSSQPSSQPSRQPTTQPSLQPSGQPTSAPSAQPSSFPTTQPSGVPSSQPSTQPSRVPTAQPSSGPSAQPTSVPSAQPSGVPTTQPSAIPTCQPSAQPSTQPSSTPSSQPSSRPSVQPSAQPTSLPSAQPSSVPSTQPTTQPSGVPSTQPSSSPTSDPTSQPSGVPSSQPTVQPSTVPSVQPSEQPTSQPSGEPTAQPSMQPTTVPTGQPSAQPSTVPSVQPSSDPSSQPSSAPSARPTGQPSVQPTQQPSVQPSSVPTAQPSAQPSTQPSHQPIAHPTGQPTSQPSSQPSKQPLNRPSSQPSGQPSTRPTSEPTVYETSRFIYSRSPSAVPTRSPTLTEKSSWVNDLQAALKDVVANDTSAVAHRSTYYELDVASGSPFHTYGGCSAWSTAISGDMKTSQYTYKVTSVAISAAVDFNSNEFVENVASAKSQCSDATVFSNIVSAVVGSPFTASRTFQCGADAWVVRFCQIGLTSVYSPAVCVNCIDPCSTVQHCIDNSVSVQAASGVLSVSPCVQQQCTGQYSPATAIRILSVGYANIEVPPSIVAVSTVSSKTSIQVTAQLSSSGSVSAAIYRTTAAASAPTSVNAVLLQNVAGSTNSANVTTFAFQGLDAATSYYMYFVATSPIGVKSTLSQVISSARYVGTACCKTVTGALFASSVIELQSQSNILSISLSSAPSVYLTVSLQLFSIDESTGAATVFAQSLFPASFPVSRIASTATVLRASLPALPAGIYEYRIVLSGDSTEEFDTLYANNQQRIEVVSATTEPSVPVLSQAVFASDGSFVTISFSANTNKGGTATSFACSTLFDFICAATSKCQWVNAATVRAYIQGTSTADACVRPGAALALSNSAQIKAKCQVVGDNGSGSSCPKYSTWAIVAATQLTISAPASPLPPTVAISAPSVIGSCDSLSLDVSGSSGSGGRSWTSSTISVLSSLNTAIGSLSSHLSGLTVLFPPPSIPAALFVKGAQYNFAVTLCNFLGQCSVGYQQVLVLNDTIPSVSLPGSRLRAIYGKDALSLASTAFISTCDGKKSSANLVYQWVISSNNVQLLSTTSTSRDASKYLLPAFALSVGAFYQVTLSVNVAGSTQSSSSSVQVFVQPGNLVAVIQGGSARTMRVTNTLRLDASASFDEDYSGVTGLAAGLQFSWSCVQISPAFSDSCDALFDNAKLRLFGNTFFDLTSLASAGDSECQVTVTVMDEPRLRSSSKTVTVSVLPELSPVVSVTAPSVPSSGVINAGQILQMTGTISVPATYGGNASWTVSDPSISLASVALFPIVTTIVELPTAASSAVTSRVVYMAFPANSLPSGSTLTFSLVGMIPYQGKQAVGSVTVTINAPPTPGSFYVSPDSGVELSQEFQFVALNWVDSDLPLTYQFEYAASNGLAVVVRSKLELSYGSFLLPAGTVEAARKVLCAVQIFDALSANNSATYATTVTEGPARNTTEIQDFVTSSLSTAGTNADAIKQAAALSSYLLNAVNCTLAPNCSSLHRKTCLSTAHTCGVCESLLYVGEEGDSNEPCYSKAEIENSRRLSSASEKSCPAGCSGHGTCMHVVVGSGKVITSDMPPCLEGDLRCLAVCDCEDSFFGSDSCEFSTEEVQQRQSSREGVVAGLQTLFGLEDPDEQVIGGWVTSLAQVSQTPSDLSGASALAVLSLVDTVTATAGSASTAVSPATISGLLNAVNSVAAASTKSDLRRRTTTIVPSGSSLTSDTVSATRDVLNSFGSLVAKSMLPGQDAAQFTQGEFRMSVQVLSGSTESGGDVSVSVPQTPLEQLLGVQQSAVTIPRDGTEDVSFVATSLRSEHFQYLGQSLMSNPLALHTSTQLCAEPPCFVDIVLQNSQAADFAVLNEEFVDVHNASCLFNDFSVHHFTCANSLTLSIRCAGVAGVVSQRCPVIHYAGACNSLGSNVGNIVSGAASGCSVQSYSDTNVTCRCEFSGQDTVRRLQSHNFTSPAGYSVSYVSMLSATASTFASTILTADDLNASTIAKGWRSMATLGTLAGAILFALFWSHSADRQAKRVKPTEEAKPLQLKDASAVKTVKNNKNKISTSVGKKVRFNSRTKKVLMNAELQIVEDSLPRVLSSRTFSDRFLEEVKQHHRWFGIVFYFSDSFPRVLRVISLATNAIIMLFIQSITYNLTNPDDGSCTALHTQTACIEPKSPYATGESKCAWMPTDSQHSSAFDGNCVFIEPDNSMRIILFVAIFCAIVTTPIALSVDWVVCNILSAPTEAPVVTSEVVTSLVPDGSTGGRVGLTRNSSATNATLVQFLKFFSDEDKIAEDKSLMATSRVELMLLSTKLKSYRDKLRPDEVEEFNLLWGLDAEGKFLTKAAEDPTLLGRLKAVFVKKEDVNVKEAVLMDLKNINAAVRKESAALCESNAPKYEIGKKLLFLFQCDLLPGISGKILELKGSRDSSTVKHVSLQSKIVGYTFLFLMNVGMLFYIMLFALTQTGPKQNAWFQSFALWLALEIFLVSTAIVFFTHILMPMLVMKDLTQIKRRLMDNIRDFNEKVKADKGKQEVEDPDAVTFNAANFLFVSTRLARQFPELKESKIIAQFSTPWPRQSYLRVQNVSKGYSKKFSAITRSASILIIFFVSNFLTVPPGIQDMIVQLTSTTAIGYIVYIHVQLYEIFPVLVILPALVLALLAHFIVQSSKADAQIKLARLFPARKKVGVKYDASGDLIASSQDAAETDGAIAVEVSNNEESKSYYSDGSFEISDEDEEFVMPAVLPVAQHRTRRQSIQTGLQLLQAMEHAGSRPSLSSSDSSDSTSSLHSAVGSDESDSVDEDSEVSDSEDSDTDSDVSDLSDLHQIQVKCKMEIGLENELLHQASNTPQQSPYTVLHKSPSALLGNSSTPNATGTPLSVASSDSDDTLSSFEEEKEVCSGPVVPVIVLNTVDAGEGHLHNVRDYESLLSTARLDSELHSTQASVLAPLQVASSCSSHSSVRSSVHSRHDAHDSLHSDGSESDGELSADSAALLRVAPSVTVLPSSTVGELRVDGSSSSGDSDNWDSDADCAVAECEAPVTQSPHSMILPPNHDNTVSAGSHHSSHDSEGYDSPSDASEDEVPLVVDAHISRPTSQSVAPPREHLLVVDHTVHAQNNAADSAVSALRGECAESDPYGGYQSDEHSVSDWSTDHSKHNTDSATPSIDSSVISNQHN